MSRSDETSAGIADTTAAAEGTPTSTGPQSGFVARVAPGMAWSFLSLAGKQVGRIGFSLLLARLLGPLNYGIVGQATIYIMLTRFFLDQGFGTALIQKDDLDDRDVGSVMWVNLASAVGLGVLTVVWAPWLATFFSTPELEQVLRVLAVDVVLMGLSVIPTALLTRGLRFRSLAVAEIMSTFVGGTAGVAAAFAGAEYWSLVIFTLVTDGVYLVVVLVAEPPRFAPPAWGRLRSLWAYGSQVMGAQILYYVMRNADNFLIAKFLGATALGFYALAYRVLMLPQQTLGQVINRVTLPVFSRLRQQPDRVSRLFSQATTALALVTFPLFTLAIVASPDAIPVLFGDRWTEAVTTMQILAVSGFITTISHLTRPVLFAYGRPDTVLRLQVLTTGASVAAFALALRWGIVGVAAAVSIVSYACNPLMLRAAMRQIAIGFPAYLHSLLPAITASLGLGTGYLLVTTSLRASSLPSLLVIVAGTAAGGIVYVVVLRTAWSAALSEAMAAARRLRRSRA